MKNKTTRLRFEEEELANKPVARAAKKAERAADKADAAKARLPTKNKLKHEKDKAADRKEQLRFGKKDNSKDTDVSQKMSGQANKKAVPDRKKPADKKGGKIKGALQVVNKLAGAVLGGGIGFLAFGFVLLCYVSVITVLKYEGDMDAAVASLDSVSSWMMENNVFQKIVDALTQVKDSIVDAAAGAALLL